MDIFDNARTIAETYLGRGGPRSLFESGDPFARPSGLYELIHDQPGMGQPYEQLWAARGKLQHDNLQRVLDVAHSRWA